MVESLWWKPPRINIKWFKLKLQTLDNEASTALKSYITENDVEYQLVSPYCHRYNAEERHQIFQRTFCRRSRISGSRFIITFMGSPFSASINDTELPAYIQAASTLVCSSALKRPCILKQRSLCSTKMQYIANEKPSQRGTWALHGHHDYS
jgi:hypothetical protein